MITRNIIFSVILSGAIIFGASRLVWAEEGHQHAMATEQGGISHYTCGMHPSVHVSVEAFDKGDTKCPICFMPLTPVEKSVSADEEFSEDVLSRVQIKVNELKLAGVKIEPVGRRELFKEIRAVGRVAYDPQLVIAQDEFISAIASLEKAKTGANPDVTSRAQSLVDSSRRKLLLLGLNDEQIDELAKKRKAQSNLILPGDKMWVYGDVYEYELNWVKVGAYIKARPISLAGEEFFGKIVSINPVVDPQTRSVRFRALINSPDEHLKPEMYVDIEIFSEYTDKQGNTNVLSIPKSALLDTGRRKVVWVQTGEGKFEGRAVEVGPEAVAHSNVLERFYPVLSGLREGEKVVTRGAFLIDSQSQITGVAAASYGGALEGEQKEQQAMPAGHQH